MSEAALIVIVLGGILVFITLLVLGIIFGMKAYQKSLAIAQYIINDRDLLLLINDEPDSIINAESLAKTSGLSLGDAKKRLGYLANSGILNRLNNSKFKTFYELKKEIQNDTLIKLSAEPYLTIEDLFELFDHHGYKMSLQDICISTGLPIEIIKREMKYFEKEGIVHSLVRTVGFVQHAVYILQEPYKNDPRRYRNIEEEVNLDLEKIYLKTRPK
ncbi:MAG: hypothetical protein KJP00_11800 [Bacteroidia bacterium]|nr:hypothetical protein [Bacteroidia bacterium]